MFDKAFDAAAKNIGSTDPHSANYSLIAVFGRAFTRIFKNEGGFQADPKDRGNWTSGRIGVGRLVGTKYGISAMTYPHLDIRNLTIDQAKAIYKRDWWDKLRMDQMHSALQYQIFDAAINHGATRAAKFLQSACGARPDGIIGPNTIAAVTSKDVNDMLMLFLAERLQFMTEIRTWVTYGKGWARRIAHNLRLAAEDN